MGKAGHGQRVSLPTGRLAAAGCGSAGLVGVMWAVLAWGLGQAEAWWMAGLAGGVVVAAACVVALVAIQPWREREVFRWALVWMAGSMVRMVATLGLTLLLYSAPPQPAASIQGSTGLWFAVAACYMAALLAETRVYASYMKRVAPGTGGASPTG